ncbi:MAG: MFS transporter [Proteobacteria bacterium]|nr:MFS transporter [Pseudomonadota bacterium]
MIFQNKLFALRFFTAVCINLLAGMEVDLFVPSFPDLMRVFNLTPFMVQLTLSLNFIAYCICSLFTGALGDRYGRRPVLLWSIFLFIIGSFLCVVAPHFFILLLGRILQGIGIAGPAILGYLVVADECPLEKQASLMGILNGMVTFGMAFAPVIGSYINFYFNWRANFITLLGLGVIVFATSFWAVPQKLSNRNISLSPKAYFPLLRSFKIWMFMGAIIFFCVPYWFFIGISPLLYMENMGVPLKEFGYYQGSIALTFGMISFTSGLFIKWFGKKVCLNVGLGLFFVSSLFLLGLAFLEKQTPFMITLGMLFLAAGIIFPVNIFYPDFLHIVEDSKARSAALFTFFRLIMTAFFLEFISAIYGGKYFLIGISLFLMSFLGVFLSLGLIKKRWVSFEA